MDVVACRRTSGAGTRALARIADILGFAAVSVWLACSPAEDGGPVEAPLGEGPLTIVQPWVGAKYRVGDTVHVRWELDTAWRDCDIITFISVDQGIVWYYAANSAYRGDTIYTEVVLAPHSVRELYACTLLVSSASGRETGGWDWVIPGEIYLDGVPWQLDASPHTLWMHCGSLMCEDVTDTLSSPIVIEPRG